MSWLVCFILFACSICSSLGAAAPYGGGGSESAAGRLEHQSGAAEQHVRDSGDMPAAPPDSAASVEVSAGGAQNVRLTRQISGRGSPPAQPHYAKHEPRPYGYLGPDVPDFTWLPCEFQKPTADELMKCMDGSFCNPLIESWECCAVHGGRAQCPAHTPFMCNEATCGGGDYCCGQDCTLLDGFRLCQYTPKTFRLGLGWLRLPLRGADGAELQGWKDTYSGSMTWELWYARIDDPNQAYPFSAGTAVMATYGDNHNTHDYVQDFSVRRRHVGVYIQPNTGQLSLGTLVGRDATEEKIMVGPNITDYNWHHIGVVWDRDKGKGWLYLDGQRHRHWVTYQPGSDNPGLEGQLVLGGGHLNRAYTCRLSQFRIWRTAFPPIRFRELMECHPPQVPKSLLSAFYWLDHSLANGIQSAFGDLEESNPGSGELLPGIPCVPEGGHPPQAEA